MHWCVIHLRTGEAWPLPCRSGWLARQCSPRVACLYTSLYIDISLFYYTLVIMPTMSCAGQTTYRRGSTAVLPHSRALHIVQRLCHWALTGRGLCVIVHQLYGYRLHYELRGEFVSHSFERRYPGYQPCKRACADIVRVSPGGLCECMLMRECLAVYGSREYVGR